MSRTFHHTRQDRTERQGVPGWQWQRTRRAMHKGARADHAAPMLADSAALDHFRQ